jgi:putative effector of murein hydrolase
VNDEDDFEIEVEGLCNCSSNSFVNALNKTAKTVFFIFLINVILGIIIYFIGEDRLSALLAVHPYLQPVIATIVGFIPNCAISILMVQLYMLDALTFGSMIAGLCSGAGVGLAVLFKNNKNMKENWLIVLYIGIVAVMSGVLIDLLLKGVIG